jgi:hypothetical protein
MKGFIPIIGFIPMKGFIPIQEPPALIHAVTREVQPVARSVHAVMMEAQASPISCQGGTPSLPLPGGAFSEEGLSSRMAAPPGVGCHLTVTLDGKNREASGQGVPPGWTRGERRTGFLAARLLSIRVGSTCPSS